MRLPLDGRRSSVRIVKQRKEIMFRFTLNRHWTFIMALSVSLLCCAASFGVSSADGPGGEIHETGDPQMGGGDDIFAGDPDVPSGTRKAARLGRSEWGGMTTGTISAGDGMSSQSVWMLRLRVALLGLWKTYLHY
jgi:hypothetical protein